MSNSSEDISSSQKEILVKFKSSLEDILTPEYSDVILIKWLKTANFNLKKAENLFRLNYYNRIISGVNVVLSTYKKPEVAQMYESIGLIGFAKDGSLIRYAGTGNVDFYGFLMSLSGLDLCLYCAYVMEMDIKTLKEENLRTGKEVNEITYVLDLEEFSIQQVLHQNVIEAGFTYIRLLQESYPLIWNNVLIINAPSYFSRAFNIFKPVMYSGIIEKIEIANKDSSQELLLKYIDADILPKFLGGTKVDSNGDPYCKEFITFGGKIPEKFYGAKTRIPLSPTDPEVICFTVTSRLSYNYPIIIKECNSKARIQVRSENGSIYVTIFYKEFGSDSENPEMPEPHEDIDESKNNNYKQISASLKFQAHCCQEDAIIMCKWPGIYVLRITHSGNWFTSKKVLFRHEILTPEQISSNSST